MSTVLLIVGIANLAMLVKVYRTLICVGKEINRIEEWKSVCKRHYF